MEFSFVLFLDVFHAPLSMASRMLMPVGAGDHAICFFVDEKGRVVFPDS
jgi:hypothetical protein